MVFWSGVFVFSHQCDAEGPRVHLYVGGGLDGEEESHWNTIVFIFVLGPEVVLRRVFIEWPGCVAWLVGVLFRFCGRSGEVLSLDVLPYRENVACG